jgi:hypothetical protein
MNTTMATQPDKDLSTIVLGDNEIDPKVAKQSAKIVASAICNTKFQSLENHSFRDIQDWHNQDQVIVNQLMPLMTRANQMPSTLSTGLYAAHAVAAAVQSGLSKDADISSIFNRMWIMNSKRHFERGIGQGSGESILSLNEELKEEIFKRAEIDIEFARALADSLGRSFLFLDESGQEKILDMINSGDPFAIFFGGSLGTILDQLSREPQKRIFELIEQDVAFAEACGIGLGYVFIHTNINQQTLSSSI